MDNRELFKQETLFIDLATGDVVGKYENTYTAVPQYATIEVPDELHRRYDHLMEPANCPHGEHRREHGTHASDDVRGEVSDRRKERMLLQFGPFYWVRMKPNKVFRPDCDPAALARAFYVGVHNYIGDRLDPGKLGLKYGAKKAVRELSATDLFDGCVSPENFDRDIMWRGRIGDVSNGLCGKLFEYQYKSAMELSGASKHRLVGRVLQMLPFVHRYTNILCKDNMSETFDFGSQLTKKDISDLFGVDATHSTRFVNELLSLEFIRNGNKYPVLYETAYGEQSVFCIHPRFYYAADILQGDHILVPGTRW